MDRIRLIISLGTLVAMTAASPPVLSAQEDGIALAIVYDTSGSMKDPVRDRTGKFSPKYVIANRALEAISARIQTFATNAASGVPRKVHAGLFVFEGTGARQGVNCGPFDASAFQGWAKTRLRQLAEQKQTNLSVHFVAFDVNAKVFDGVKKLGATVVGASDEAQLTRQLEFILEKKILLEDEELPTKK